ncbi:hypothetical protein [Viridibacillus arvi]|uniref:hypothetical protein n=1 Tax=Viridibacillus arvi TaxID=263475 RepID=UPI00187B3542|nr:hypothetical protein [Viridibacillus sp. JNUCC-6]QOV10424.1 hypothetical protein JNUCC6_17830 [Viridibacillus sp. JNUCC-6]
MGKFNLKFVKPVASLAIGAAVLTGSFAVTGAADTAFAKAATVKVSKGKLVSAKSGKAVKGYKSYKGVLYKNGKKFTGLYKNTYYKSGKKGTGLYKNVYYKAGKKGSGWVGSGSSKKWYQDGKLLTGLGKNSGKLFIKGKYANGIQTYKGVEKLYKDGVVVKTVVDAAKAINNTTVEVTFAEAQKADDIKAGRFAIEGLEISNAAIKQTDSKVIVLTTSVQEGGKTYTVALDGVKSRTFKGVSSVIPTGITSVENSNSLQGIFGKEVTVKAQVTVADGQSKAGIPVTFNVPGNQSTLAPTLTAEVTTDANGVASYSYTRYQATTDDVLAYATGDRSKFASSKVYWGVTSQLSISEVNEGTTIKNGSNKTYKVKLVNTNGNAIAGKKVHVSFLENVNAEVNKLSSATINGVNPSQLKNGSAIQTAEVTTDSNGEAVFTVTGTNTTATPVVFVPTETSPANNVYSAGLLQAVASKVTFSAQQTDYTLKIVGSGTKDAATGYDNAREFTVTVTGKDGKPAANEVVKLGLNEIMDNVISTNTSAKFVTFKADGTVDTTSTTGSVKTNAKGEATFYVGSTVVNDYATPFAWIDINSSNASANGVFEQGEPSVTGELTNFTAERLVSSQLVTKNAVGTSTSNFESGSYAKYQFQLTNQSGNEITFGNAKISTVTAQFNVYNNGANDVLVFKTKGAADAYIATQNASTLAAGTLISANRSEQVEVSGSTADIYVVPVAANKSASVSVTSSAVATKDDGTKVSLVVAGSKDAKFTATNEVTAVHTGVVGSFDTSKKTITFNGKDPVAYAGETGKTYAFKGLGGTPISTATAFIAELSGASGAVTATYEVKDDVVTFYIVSIKATGSTPTDTVLEDNKAAAKAVTDTFAALTFANSAAPTAVEKKAVVDARAAYEKLTTAQKATVTAATLKVLTDAEKVVSDAQLASDTAAAKAVTDTFAALTFANPAAPTAVEKKAVVDARAAYEKLTTAQKATVTAATLKVLTDAEAIVAASI